METAQSPVRTFGMAQLSDLNVECNYNPTLIPRTECHKPQREVTT